MLFKPWTIAMWMLLVVYGCKSEPEQPSISEQTVDELILHGQNAFNQGMYEKSLEYYQAALAKQPQSATVYNLMGMAYRFRYNQLHTPELKSQEIQAFEKSIQIDPNFVVARVNLGSSYYYAGKKIEAAEQFKKVLELLPNHPEAEQLMKMIAEADHEQSPSQEAQRLK